MNLSTSGLTRQSYRSILADVLFSLLDTKSISAAEALEDFVLFTKHFKALQLRVNKSEIRHFVAP